MKNALVILLFLAAAFSSLTSPASASDQYLVDRSAEILSRIIRANQLPYSVTVVADRSVSTARIHFSSGVAESRVHVNPNVFSQWPDNTKAFVLGHELSHQFFGHQTPGRELEDRCDVQGARFAMAAGYSLRQHLDHALANRLRNPGEAARISRLAAQFGIAPRPVGPIYRNPAPPRYVPRYVPRYMPGVQPPRGYCPPRPVCPPRTRIIRYR